MPTRTADCVLQATPTVGTGDLALGAAVAGYRTLAAAVAAGDLVAGDRVPYRVEAVDADGVATGDWETGLGAVGAGGLTLSRDEVRASSAGGAAVNFPAGGKYVFLTDAPSDELVLTFGWNNASPRQVGTVPAGHTVTRVRLAVTTAFLDAASELAVGTAGDPAAFLSPGQCDPAAAADYETTPLAPCAAATAVVLTITPGGGESAGAGSVTVEYEPTSGG